MKFTLAALVFLQMAATCAAPPYQRPDASLPSAYRSESRASQLVPPMGALGWWEVFKDPELQALLRTAVTHNYDTQIAAQRVREAQSQFTIAGANRYPQLNAVLSAQYTKTNGPQNSFIPREEFLPYGLLTLQYEVDLFGKVRSETAAAAARVLQSEFGQETVVSTVVSSVASLYFELRELELELAVSRQSLEAREQSLAIVQARYQAGRGTLQEVAQAQQLVAEVNANIALIQRSTATVEDALSILVGGYPGAIPAGLALQGQIAMPAIPSAGLPSALLEQRPDIRAAEQNLIAANAEIGVARALLFPQFTIGAAVGAGTAQINGIYYPEGIFSILPQIVQQVFNAGAARANVTKSEAAKQEAVLGYVESIHQSFGEVSDALIAYDQNRKYAAAQASNSSAAAEALRLANIRFVNGRTSYLDVVVNESRAYEAEIAYAQSQLAERDALVQLYHATGGGWQPEPEATQTTP